MSFPSEQLQDGIAFHPRAIVGLQIQPVRAHTRQIDQMTLANDSWKVRFRRAACDGLESHCADRASPARQAVRALSERISLRRAYLGRDLTLRRVQGRHRATVPDA